MINIALMPTFYPTQAQADFAIETTPASAPLPSSGTSVGVTVGTYNITELDVDRLVAGSLQADILLTTGLFRTGTSPDPRIEISQTLIAGYSDATTKQFYLDASDGKAYAGGGKVMLDSAGLTITNTGSDTSIMSFKYNTTELGTIFAESSYNGIVIQSKPSGSGSRFILVDARLSANDLAQVGIGCSTTLSNIAAVTANSTNDYMAIIKAQAGTDFAMCEWEILAPSSSFLGIVKSTTRDEVYVAGPARFAIYDNGGLSNLKASIDGATGKATFGAGASAATWPSAHFGDPDLGFFARGTSAAPVASGKAVVAISDYTSGNWDDANMGALMVYSKRTGGSSNGIVVGTASGAVGKATCGIESHTIIATGTGAGAGDHASAFAGWFSGQLWTAYDRLSVVEINPVNASGSDAPDAGEYGSTAMLSNALALVAAGSKQSSSALYIGSQNTTTSQFQRGIDFKQASIANYAIVLPNAAPVVSRNAADNAKVELYRLDSSNNWTTMAMTLTEQTAPSAPAANQVTVYAVDNGAGKTQLMALFSSGAAQQLAIQP